MNIKKHIPNLFTLGNLLCGTLALLSAFNGNFENTFLLVVLGIVFDFFDGFLARILKVSGELGKQLDSLADMVTSGVVPGLVMYFLIFESSYENLDKISWAKGILSPVSSNDYSMTWLPYLGLLLTLAACYRLAKFNIDTRQSDSFIGLPTPAMSLFVVSLPIILEYTEIELIKDLITNNYFLIGVTLVLSYLMNAELPLFSLKFKNYGFIENIFKYLLLIFSIILLVTVHFLAIPIIIVLYIILSIINNIISKNETT